MRSPAPWSSWVEWSWSWVELLWSWVELLWSSWWWCPGCRGRRLWWRALRCRVRLAALLWSWVELLWSSWWWCPGCRGRRLWWRALRCRVRLAALLWSWVELLLLWWWWRRLWWRALRCRVRLAALLWSWVGRLWSPWTRYSQLQAGPPSGSAPTRADGAGYTGSVVRYPPGGGGFDGRTRGQRNLEPGSSCDSSTQKYPPAWPASLAAGSLRCSGSGLDAWTVSSHALVGVASGDTMVHSEALSPARAAPWSKKRRVALWANTSARWVSLRPSSSTMARWRSMVQGTGGQSVPKQM